MQRVGNGVPAAGLGQNNDAYTDLTTGLQYIKAGGAWGQIIQPNLPASKITGVLDPAQVPAISSGMITSLAASKITGQLADSQIAALAAAKLTGTVADAQIAGLSASKLSGTVPFANLPPVEYGYADAAYSSTFSGGWAALVSVTCAVDNVPLVLEAGGGYLATGSTANAYVFTAFMVGGTLTGAGGSTGDYQSLQADSPNVGQIFVNSYKRIRIPAKAAGTYTFAYAIYFGVAAGTAAGGGGNGYDKFWIRVGRA